MVPFSLLEPGQTEKTIVRPWFWILWLFFVPIFGSMGFQYYVTTMNHVVVRAESILTQLVFNYSLRVRVVSEGSEQDKDKKKDTSSFLGKLNNLVTSDLSSITQANHFVLLCECRYFLLGSYLVDDSSSLVSPSATHLLLRVPVSHPRVEVSLFYFLCCPLYGSYVWIISSAFVGLGLMVALLPVPGYMTNMLQGIQAEKMKKV
jgi:hypothetical protein